MNNFIVLDGKKYTTPAKSWTPLTQKPGTVRFTLLGNLDTTYGPVTPLEWQGQIEAPVTPKDAGWGTIDDLRASLAKRQAVAFTDHYGNAYTVATLPPFQEKSLMPKWDAAENKIFVQVRILTKRDA